nr:type I restriction-modification system endonuclease [Marinigracilibium pacificum]
MAAEYNLYEDPVTALFKLRQFGERLTQIIYEEHQIEFPSNTQFLHLLKGLQYEGVLPDAIKDLLHNIRMKGNDAVHNQKGTTDDAKGVLYSAFKIAKWFFETYGQSVGNIAEYRFSPPKNLDARHALNELEKEHEELKKKFEQALKERTVTGLNPEEKVAIQQRSEKALKKLELNEAETRQLIDNQLRQVGWEANTEEINFKSHKSLPEKGKNKAIAEWPCNGKWADYALFIGTELYAIIEAKKYAEDISTNLDQPKIYAERVEAVNEAELLGEWSKYKVPFLFSTNGRPYLEQIKTKSGVWFLDVREAYNNSRALQGWYSPEGLKNLFGRNIQSAEEKLKNESAIFLQNELGLRNYQIKAIKAVEKHLLENPEVNRSLITMATGTGKTRTIIGLCYRLIQSNRFKRILFLVDRTLLAKQAIDAFSDNKIVGLNTFSEIYDVKGLKDLVPDADTRLHFATVQGMVKRLFYSEDDNIPAVDQYDCIIIDEAHRGYLLDKELDEDELDFKNQMDYVSKYRMVLDYFDAYAIGLTATPALHTKEIFGLPVFTYSYREAVIDGYLIDHDPPYSIKTKLGEEGIVWQKGEKPKALDREGNEIVELSELEDELKIEIAGFNRQVITDSFNRTVIKQLVQELDPDGEEKTLVFAATDEHADRVVQLFKEEFEEIGIPISDDMIQKITGKSYDPQEQLKRFKNEKYPNIVVTVDLLTTGIDVPAICNLVFLRRIKSRILFEQMLGRATRRCDEIGKEVFHIYDAVKIYDTLEDYTQMKPVVVNPSANFQQLVEELEQIDSEKRTQQQINQIIAKIQRKKSFLSEKDFVQFRYNSGDLDPDELIEQLKQNSPQEATEQIKRCTKLWQFLDEYKPLPRKQLVSDHDDELHAIERGYGKAKKPEDYLESFSKFIKENQNKIQALNIICSKPAQLDRKSLKELLLELDQQGYNESSLKVAWKEAKNEDIAADIIAYIRTLALGTSLRSKEERVKQAVDKIRQMKDWNKVQQQWLDRFENQLIAESVLQVPDLDRGLFKEKGGFKRLNKIFGEELEDIIRKINQNLYTDIA